VDALRPVATSGQYQSGPYRPHNYARLNIDNARHCRYSHALWTQSVRGAVPTLERGNDAE